ncbi:MAG: SMC-Scp complex subunit ScpB [Actinomycetota bacterium]|nr:SMC-Scp complex subunit ScpB [Actinomycetota bacterium]
MDHATNRQALEAILFVVDEPVGVPMLSEVLEVSQIEVEAELVALASQLEEERRGFVLRNVSGGWRFYTAPEVSPYVERWVRGRRSGRLSRASLETLAVIAYKQPVSRAEVGEVRGVNADGAMRTLIARGLIGEVGRDGGPGQAVLYGTTARFLEDLGINSLADLPPLTDFLPPGPAPDEPSPEDQRAARAALRAGRELPATGQARWEPRRNVPESEATFEAADDAGAAPAARDDPTPACASEPPPAHPARDDELDALTEALERATRNAIAVLEDALQAVEPAPDPGPDAFDPATQTPGLDEFVLENTADSAVADLLPRDRPPGGYHPGDHSDG